MTSTASPTRPHLTSRRVRRTATVVATTAAALLLGPGVASAHVSITTETAAPGSYSTVGFRVPNESDTAATTTVEIQLPTDSPFSFVSAQQAPGWTISTTETTFPEPVTVGAVTVDKAVTTVTFTADGAGLAPHEFTVFSLLLGPIPDVDSLTFGAIQTYDDGEVVSWTDPTPASGAEPAHPAPVLTVSGEATDGRAHGGDDGVSAAADGTTTTTTAAAAPTADATARVLGVAGIVVGLAGLGSGVVLARGRRQRSGPDERGAL